MSEVRKIDSGSGSESG